jgi:hypothetical protein
MRMPVMLALMIVTAAPAAPPDPPFVKRNAPGPAHAMLRPLAGDWTVEMRLYGAGGTPMKPLVGRLVAHRTLVASGKFLREELTGSFAGRPYWRTGMLGYSNADRRFEWVTQDALNTNMMIYLGQPGSGDRLPIEMTGRFTDTGVVGEGTVGRTIAQRIEIQFVGRDRQILRIYFKPPGGREMLFDEKIYTRRRG